MRGTKVCILLFLQIHLALYFCWEGSSGWSYAPPYLVPYGSEQSCNQYTQPVYFGPPQDANCYSMQYNSYTMYQTPLETQCYTGYGNCLQEAQYSPYGTQYYQQTRNFSPVLEVDRNFLQANGEHVILLPENNCGVKFVPPIASETCRPVCNSSPYPYPPPIIIINNDDDDDNNDLFDFDDDGGFGLKKFLALFLALQGRSDRNPFTPPPPPPPPGNWGNPSDQNCQCCCCKYKCGSDSKNGNSFSDNPDSGSSGNCRGTTTHITLVLPKSWGVSQTGN